MSMSSRRAAARATMEFIEFLANWANNKPDVFRTYSKMQNVPCSRSAYHKKMKRFEKYGFVKKSKADQGQVYLISQKAKIIRRKAVTKKNRTDGMGTLIIFDISEEKRNARDTLRRYLIRSGYTQIRESAFLSPFQVFDDLKGLIEELKLEKNVSFFAVKPEYYFKQFF